MSKWINIYTDGTELTVEAPNAAEARYQGFTAERRPEREWFGNKPEGCTGVYSASTHLGAACPVHDRQPQGERSDDNDGDAWGWPSIEADVLTGTDD